MTKQPDQGWREHVLNTLLPTMEANTGAAAGFAPGPANPQPMNFAGAHISQSFDVLDALPPGAQDRLRKLRDRAADAHAVCVPHADLHEASMAKIEAEQRLRQLQAHPQNFGANLPDDNNSVLQARRLLTKATEDFERIKQRSETKTAAWQAASAALSNAETWLKSGRPGGTTPEECDWPEPQLNKGEGILDGIERLRRRCRELKADLHRIASAPFPSSYNKQRLRQMVEQFAARGAPDVSMLIEHDGDIVWPMLRVQSEVIGAAQRAVAFHEAVDVVGLFACLLKPAMISFLDAMVDAEQDDAAALTHEQRQKDEAEVMGDLLAVERDEAALTWSAMKRGLPVEFRPDISPLAILGLRLVTVPRAAPPPSSPEHAGFDLAGGRR